MAVDYIAALRKLQNMYGSMLTPSRVQRPAPDEGFPTGNVPVAPPAVSTNPGVVQVADTPDASDPGGSWNIPDYGALLGQHMAPVEADARAESIADRASRNAGFRRAAIAFGELPDVAGIAQALGLSLSDLGDVFGSDTAALARGNTQAGTSTVARLGEAHQDAARGITNALASRGILRSGETGFQQSRENLNYTRAQYDARNRLLDYLSGLQSGFVSAERQRAQALAQARMQAALAIQGMYQPTWAPNPARPGIPTFNVDTRLLAGSEAAPPPPAANRRSPFGHQPA